MSELAPRIFLSVGNGVSQEIKISLKQRMEIETYYCEYCGKTFVPTHKDQKFCRMSHYRGYRRGNRL